jgi:acetyl esterase/lipase
MGFSTGGSIAQYVALACPGAVRSLVLIVSASRLSEEGRETCKRWQALAREERWHELRADMASVTVSSEANKRLARAFMKVFGRFVLRVPSDPQDFLTTLEADLNHDTTGRLSEISAPTLLIGGSDDPFFSESLLRETAQKIPDAILHVYEGVGHGVPKERKRRYENDTLAFLDDRLDGFSDGVGKTMSSQVKEMRLSGWYSCWSPPWRSSWGLAGRSPAGRSSRSERCSAGPNQSILRTPSPPALNSSWVQESCTSPVAQTSSWRESSLTTSQSGSPR